MNHACEQCFPNAVEIGLVAPGLSLVLHEGKYRLVCGDGHKVLLAFQGKPWPDPDPECDNDHPEGDRWIEEAEAELSASLRMDPESGHALVLTCQGGGFGKDGHPLLVHWLYDKCGRLIVEANP